MILIILELLKIAPKYERENIDFAKGSKLYPSDLKELKQYVKWQLKK